ncbi:MAG: sigma-54 interaction domain-containing protein [Desulfomonilaceae bacterium]
MLRKADHKGSASGDVPPANNSQGFLFSDQKTVTWCFSILDSIYDGILVADESAVVRYVNPEYTRITGVGYDEIVGRPLLDVRPGAILPEVIRTGRPREGVFRREGNIEYVVDMAPIIIDGRIVGGVSVVKDITEVQSLSSELKKFKNRADRLKSAVHLAYGAKYTFDDVLGVSDSIRQTVSLAKRLSAAENHLLITGESGTGKEVFAHAIHSAGRRHKGPFVPVSCAALPSMLIESELFGYGDGAFTGARKGGKVGLFEVADEGTIFLDEIAELPVDMQSKLLRALQEGTIRRIGETVEYEVDIRVIAGTNRDLRAMVAERHFREDLFYRLNAMNIHLPPLRERGEDIRIIADSTLERLCNRSRKDFVFSPEVYPRLSNYVWPGNVRELIHAVAFAANMSEGPIITADALPKELQSEVGSLEEPKRTLADILRDVEKGAIESRLRLCGFDLSSKKKIASAFGISLATLYNKMKSLGIKKG